MLIFLAKSVNFTAKKEVILLAESVLILKEVIF